MLRTGTAAFLGPDGRWLCRSNLRSRKIASPLAAGARSGLGYADRVEPPQHLGNARGLSHALRADVVARAEDPGANSESTRAESRWHLRPAAARSRRHQDADQGRHRPRAGRQGGALPRADHGGGADDPGARRDSLRAEHDALRDRRRHSVFLRGRIGDGAGGLHGRLGQQQQVFHARRDARHRADGQLRAAAHRLSAAGGDGCRLPVARRHRGGARRLLVRRIDSALVRDDTMGCRVVSPLLHRRPGGVESHAVRRP